MQMHCTHKDIDKEGPKPLISSIYVEVYGGHADIHIWSRGGKAGFLTVNTEDAEEIAARLLPLSQRM